MEQRGHKLLIVYSLKIYFRSGVGLLSGKKDCMYLCTAPGTKIMSPLIGAKVMTNNTVNKKKLFIDSKLFHHIYITAKIINIT